MKQSSLILLVDGDHLFYRCLHQFIDFNYRGQFTGGFYGFIGSFNRMLKEYKPDKVVICWGDRRENLWRRELYSEYKGTRKPLRINFEQQLKWTVETLSCCGVSQLKVEKYEADDLIAHIVNRQFHKLNNFNILIVSGDKDLRQLVKDGENWVRVAAEIKGQTIIYDEKKVKEKMGVSPNDLPLYLAIVGDRSDNIPGISGIGPKTAIKYINGEASAKKIKQIESDTTLENWKTLVDIRNMKLTSPIKNMIKGCNNDWNIVEKILTEAGCANTLTEKLQNIKNEILKSKALNKGI